MVDMLLRVMSLWAYLIPESVQSHRAFDEGFGPVPKKWKGECAGGLNFTCNKKVIGARSYSINGTSFSARDIQGHGTHVASIAAGNEVKHASFSDLAQGTMFTVSNDAPWILTVAATNIDRRFIDKGTSINSFPLREGKVPIVYGKEVTNNCYEFDARSCYMRCLERSRIHGKVVICDVNTGIAAVRAAGALGCIVPNLGNKSIMNPEAKIFKSEAIRNPDAPLVASDSSRGPSIYFPDLIKR
ncbi:hypothetical protein CTI12_AA478490 [Artemisia annua]|uniref:Uncharacterized protein n=1 Tax=Artemisia annua TaxID=35608 RepID=A0A2U1LJX0_ARTAN|nr:hypothetical protein CTI12_AA478490 [Artemisia annua]